MNFRVTATVEKVSPRGTKYGHILYCGDFNAEEHTGDEAVRYAEERVKQIAPRITGVTIDLEEFPNRYSIH